MNDLLAFLASCGTAAALAIGAFLFLRAPLERLLVELCDGAERARFWSCFTGLSLLLTTVLGCMLTFPLGDAAAWKGDPVVRHVLVGLRSGLFLLLFVVAFLGLVLGRAIANFERDQRPQKPAVGELPSPG